MKMLSTHPLHFLLTFGACLCLWSTPGQGVAQEVPIELPGGGDHVLSFQQDQVQFRQDAVEGNATWLEMQGMPFSKALQIKASVRFSKPTNLLVHLPLKNTIRKGDVLLLSFWIRRPNAGGQPNNVFFSVRDQNDAAGFEYKLGGYRTWKQHVRAFVAKNDFDASKSSVKFLLGEAGTVCQIADLKLLNYGPKKDVATLPRSTVHYSGRSADATWRKEALDRIDRIRKAKLAINVVDENDEPFANAKVKIEMQRHAFGFGNVVNATLLGGEESDFPYTKVRNGKKITSTFQQAAKYRAAVKQYFNTVTFESELRPHVWKRMQDGSGSSSRLKSVFAEKAVPWLQQNSIRIRGHYLSWGAMDFNALEKQFVGNPKAHRAWLWAHMADVIPKTKFVSEWDTVNHIIAWGKHTYEKEYGSMRIYADIMEEARRLAPNARHAINEGKVLPNGYKREPYQRVIRFLNEQGQSPDVVGFMGHFGLTTLTPPEELLEVYDDFGKIAPKLQLSEFDVDVGDDEQLQADYLRDVMIASFSHPNFVSIVQWGFWENAHWKPEAALWRKDWTLKPAGKVFVQLTTKQWWTDETAQTNQAGACEVRGFLGDYRVTVRVDGQVVSKDVTLVPNGSRLTIKVKRRE